RNAVEELAHIQNGIDGNAGHADIPGHARVVAVIAAMRGEIEGDGKALLPGYEVAAVDGVGFLGSREARILPDRPGLLDIHGRIGPSDEGRQAGVGVEVGQAIQIRMAVEAFNGNAFGGVPRTLGDGGGPFWRGPRNAAEVGNHALALASSSTRIGRSGSQWTMPSVGAGLLVAASVSTVGFSLKGCSVAPTIGRRPLTYSSASRARASRTRFWRCPSRRLTSTPPSASMRWNSAHAASHISSVRASMLPEPNTGSATWSRWLSRNMMICVLRAMRRAKLAGNPCGIV